MPDNYFVDLHCHPAMKPYGKSFDTNPTGINDLDKSQERSIWHKKSDGLIRRVESELAGFPAFTQCDFTTLARAEATVIGVALYPLEKRFVQLYNASENKWKNPVNLRDILLDGVTGIGQNRIQYIQQLQDYFTDMLNEFDYYDSLKDKPVTLGTTTAVYKIAKNFGDIQENLAKNDARKPFDPLIISLFITIEGAHVFNAASYIDSPASAKKIETMIADLKKLPAVPFFLTFCHHYYNGLCGQARSLNKLISDKSPQDEGLNQPINALGKKVLDLLLSKTNGKRILIDVKHMSAIARDQYYQLISSQTGSDRIPIIVSHGAVNGLNNFIEQKKINWTDRDVFLNWPINFYDNEIIAIAKSEGIFGIQLDERRIASITAIHAARGGGFSRPLTRLKRSSLLWNQIAYIAELLDSQNLFAWGIQSIGSDNDGIINPVNGFETAEDYQALELCLISHAQEYLNSTAFANLKMPGNKNITAAEIVSRVMRHNAHDFLSRWFW